MDDTEYDDIETDDIYLDDIDSDDIEENPCDGISTISYFECWINKNALLQTVFLPILPTGNE